MTQQLGGEPQEGQRRARSDPRGTEDWAVATEGGGRQSVRGSKLKSGPPPPLSAEKLLLFVLPPRISDPIVGDLAERLPSIQERHGDWFARAWYWRHAVGAVIRFVGPRLA